MNRRVVTEILILSGLIYTILLFGLLSSGFFHSVLFRLDALVASFVTIMYSPVLEKFFLFFTYFANWQVVAIFSFFIILFFIHIHDRKDIVLFMGSILIGLFTSMFFKAVIGRERPTEALIPISFGTDSFPSGHALMAVVFYGLFAAMLSHTIQIQKNKKFLWLATGILILLIGVSRVYLGVHWFSDVLAGWALGAILLELFVTLFDRIHAIETHPKRL